MATHSSTLAWKIPWMEEPGRLQSMGSLRVGHNWTTSLSLFTFMHWRRKWQPTPVFLPGESQGRGSLVGCCLWGRTRLKWLSSSSSSSNLHSDCYFPNGNSDLFRASLVGEYERALSSLDWASFMLCHKHCTAAIWKRIYLFMVH